MLKIHSGYTGLCSGLSRKLPAKSFDLTDLMEKDLATWKTESSLFRNPLRFLAQSLCLMQKRTKNARY